MRKPWFRASDGWWYISEGAGKSRRHIRLSQDEQDAIDKWHARSIAPRVDDPEPLLVAMFEAHLVWSVKNQPSATYEWKKRYITPFVLDCGHIAMPQLRPFDLTKWLDDHDLPTGARRATITAIKTALNWCVDEGLLKANPLARFKRPPTGRREQLIEADARAKILSDADPAFRILIIAMAQTGCRPAEVRTVDASKFDKYADAWVFPPQKHKTGKKTGRKRIVHLTPCIGTLSRILAHFRPDGPLFLNSRGEPWTNNALRLRMQRIRENHNLPEGTVAYSFRHTFTTEGIANGVGSSVMAELLGHRDTSMIDRHYGHLDQRTAALKKAVRTAAGKATA